MIDIEKCEDIININDITDIDDIKNQCEYWKHKRGKQKEKTYKDSVNLLNEEEVTNINNITNKKDIINIIDQVTSKDGEGGNIETTTELNQCSYIEDKKAKELCEERIDDDSHGVDPIDIETIDDVKNLNDEKGRDNIINNFEYWKHTQGKQKHKSHKDSVDLINYEDVTNINNITNIEDIRNIIDRLISKDGEGDIETTTELNQCSYIEDKKAKALCEERINDHSHGVDPIDIQTIDDVKNLNDETDPDVIRNCFEYWKYKEGKQKHKTHKDSVDLLNIEDITDINTITNVEDIKNIIERLISQVTEPNQCSFIEDKKAKEDCESRMYDDDHGDDGPEDGR